MDLLVKRLGSRGTVLDTVYRTKSVITSAKEGPTDWTRQKPFNKTTQHHDARKIGNESRHRRGNWKTPVCRVLD